MQGAQAVQQVCPVCRVSGRRQQEPRQGLTSSVMHTVRRRQQALLQGRAEQTSDDTHCGMCSSFPMDHRCLTQLPKPDTSSRRPGHRAHALPLPQHSRGRRTHGEVEALGSLRRHQALLRGPDGHVARRAAGGAR